MQWIQLLLFCLFAGLKIACFILAARSGIGGKHWLLTFLALSLGADVGNVLPMLAANREELSMAEHANILGNANMATKLLGAVSWAALLGFVLELRGQTLATLLSSGASPLPQAGTHRSLRFAAGAALIVGALLGQFSGGLMPGDAPISLAVLACSGIAAVLVIKGQSSQFAITALVAASLLLLAALTFINPTHWKADGIWLVDWLALALHILALVLVQQLRKQDGT